MKVTKFLSGQTYLVLPTKLNPKVFLAIEDKKVAKNSFELYNPFSNKAKLLKTVTEFLSVYCNTFAKMVLPTVKVNKSKFIGLLEMKLGKQLTSSAYFATERDKIVLQLQDKKGIFGYLKYAVSQKGKQRLLNEKRAISILSRQNVVPDLVFKDTYKKKPFIVIKNIQGKIGPVSELDYRSVLSALKKDKRFKLKEHPRVLDLMNKLLTYNLNGVLNNLQRKIEQSTNEYLEVFEHGDFAPWNLKNNGIEIIPFDFEYFVDRGLEYMDEVKYHFQVEYLLKGKKEAALIQAVSERVDIEEFWIVFQIFLIKEIINKCDMNESFDFESSLLNISLSAPILKA